MADLQETCRLRALYCMTCSLAVAASLLAELLRQAAAYTPGGRLLRPGAAALVVIALAASGRSLSQRSLRAPQLPYRRSTAFRDAVTAWAPGRSSSARTAPGKMARSVSFNRTRAIEWAYRRPYTTSTDRAAASTPWLEFYNNQRQHTALGGQPPAAGRHQRHDRVDLDTPSARQGLAPATMTPAI